MVERKNLKAARMARNLTQDQVATSIGLTRTMITQIEKGTANGSEATWRKLAALLGKSVDHLWRLSE